MLQVLQAYSVDIGICVQRSSTIRQAYFYWSIRHQRQDSSDARHQFNILGIVVLNNSHSLPQGLVNVLSCFDVCFYSECCGIQFGTFALAIVGQESLLTFTFDVKLV